MTSLSSCSRHTWRLYCLRSFWLFCLFVCLFLVCFVLPSLYFGKFEAGSKEKFARAHSVECTSSIFLLLIPQYNILIIDLKDGSEYVRMGSWKRDFRDISEISNLPFFLRLVIRLDGIGK